MFHRSVAGLLSILAAAAILVWTTAATGATEQELFDRLTDEQEARVLELLDEGEAAYQQGDYDRAAARFHEVHNLFPHPSVSYRLAQTYDELDDKERALQYYNHFLDLEPDAAERDDIETRIDELEAAIDEISFIRVESIPVGASIYVGDRETVPVGETPEPVTLEPGDHEIIVDKQGYESDAETITVREGDDRIVQFELVEARDVDDPDAPRDTGTAWWKPTMTVAMVGFGGLMTYQAIRTDDPSMRRIMGVGAGAMLLGAAGFTFWWATRDDGPALGMGTTPEGDAAKIGIRGRF